jgi:hypothetical protein
LMSYRHISPSGDGQLLNTMKANWNWYVRQIFTEADKTKN